MHTFSLLQQPTFIRCGANTFTRTTTDTPTVGLTLWATDDCAKHQPSGPCRTPCPAAGPSLLRQPPRQAFLCKSRVAQWLQEGGRAPQFQSLRLANAEARATALGHRSTARHDLEVGLTMQAHALGATSFAHQG